MKKLIFVVGATVVAAGCSSNSGPPCPSGVTSCVSIGAGTTSDDIETDFATLKDGDTVVFGAGTFMMTDTITIAANNVTVIGAGSGQTIFDFSGQKGGDGEGFFAQSVQNITLQGFTVRDTLGNAVKVLGSTGVTFRDIATLWTSDDPSTHGGYGLYPVQSTNVLVENCDAAGASDTGIYLGQSSEAVLRNNTAHDNVAGIEVENTYFAEVYGNDVHDNAGGILVFALPGLQQLGTHDVLVHDNKIHDNNTDNFAPQGNTVGMVPRGTGLLVMAATNVECLHNTISNNETGNSGVLSYYATQQPIQDPNYYPLATKVWIHDNIFSGGGDLPDLKKPIGLLLSTAQSVFPNGAVPDLLFDGVEDPALAQQTPTNPDQICYQNNGAVGFVDLHIDQLNSTDSNLVDVMTQDVTDYTCSLAPGVAPVTFPGLTP